MQANSQRTPLDTYLGVCLDFVRRRPIADLQWQTADRAGSVARAMVWVACLFSVGMAFANLKGVTFPRGSILSLITIFALVPVSIVCIKSTLHLGSRALASRVFQFGVIQLILIAILAAYFVVDLGPLNPVGAVVTPGILFFVIFENAMLIVLVEIINAIIRRHAVMTANPA